MISITIENNYNKTDFWNLNFDRLELYWPLQAERIKLKQETGDPGLDTNYKVKLISSEQVLHHVFSITCMSENVSQKGYCLKSVIIYHLNVCGTSLLESWAKCDKLWIHEIYLSRRWPSWTKLQHSLSSGATLRPNFTCHSKLYLRRAKFLLLLFCYFIYLTFCLVCTDCYRDTSRATGFAFTFMIWQRK